MSSDSKQAVIVYEIKFPFSLVFSEIECVMSFSERQLIIPSRALYSVRKIALKMISCGYFPGSGLFAMKI
mgnify:CR=1 FL=1